MKTRIYAAPAVKGLIVSEWADLTLNHKLTMRI